MFEYLDFLSDDKGLFGFVNPTMLYDKLYTFSVDESEDASYF